LNASQYLREEDVVSPGVAPGVRDPFGIPRNSSDSEFRRSNASFSNLFTLSDRIKVTAGASVEREEGESDSILFFGPAGVPGRFSLDRTTYALFGEAEVELPGGLILQPGLRVDFPEDFATQYSPRVGALYRVESTGTTLKAAWGRGFKLPAFYSLANPIIGNPDLKPEKSESWDAGVSQEFWNERGVASLTLFHSRFEDIIDFDAGPPPRLVNRSEAAARGAELGLTLRPSDSLTANGHLTYTKTEIKDSDDRLRSRPKWRGGVDVDWRPRPDLTFFAGLLYVGKVFDSSVPTGDRWLDDYVRVDIAATWRPLSNLALTLAVDNLLDAKYDEAVGFRAAGVRPRLSARVTF
jgi:iron complex outermembrane receptor protein/vitamin B12 transporter